MDTEKSDTGYGRLVDEMQPPQYDQVPIDHRYAPQSMPTVPPPQQQQPPQFNMQSHHSNNTTVVVAPTSQNITIQHVPTDHIGFAIFTTLCCFWPVGIFAILRARDVHKKAWEGDMAGSVQASRSAQQLSFIALGIGIGIILLNIIIIVIAVINASRAIEDASYP